MKLAISLCAFSLVLGLVTAQAQGTSDQTKAEPQTEKKPAAKGEKAAAGDEVAVIKTTEGDMIIQFWPDVAPKTVENFKTLAKKGFYDGTAFHRIIKGFMIQGGDPHTKDLTKEALWGQGDPGYKIDAEFNKRPHVRGVISMARGGDPQERFGAPPRPQYANSAGSQFFICDGVASSLDGKYTAFGKLIKGDDVLEKIANTPVTANSMGEPSKPTKRIVVQGIKIVPADSVK
jgi:peptidyl-prolyl cis-trans isomerase B (cyclophilin B)